MNYEEIVKQVVDNLLNIHGDDTETAAQILANAVNNVLYVRLNSGRTDENAVCAFVDTLSDSLMFKE